MPEKQNKSTQAAPAKSGSFITLVDIILLVAIALVFYGSGIIRGHVQELSSQNQKLSVSLSDEVIKVQSAQGSSKCPHAKQDYDSCLDKLKRCKDTEVQFAKAESEFKKLITDCADSNDQNEKINIEMEGELKKLQKHLETLEKK